MRRVGLPVLAALLTGCAAGSLLAGCAAGPRSAAGPARTAPPGAASAAAAGMTSAGPAAAASPVDSSEPDPALPVDSLRALVPAAGDLPPGLIAIRAGSGPRDARAIAGYSADPRGAATLLARHGFRRAYAAEYADPTSGRLLSVVVSRFATAAGAAQDLEGDLAGSTGRALAAPTIGVRSAVRTQALPAGRGELVTVRFVVASTTWLVAYGAAPTADPAVPVELARRLARRG